MKRGAIKRSISTKLSLMAASTMFVCTMGSVGFFLVGNFRESVTAEQNRLQSVASVFCAVLSEPVASANQVQTRNALRALRDIPSLQQASVHDANGRLLGEMGGGAVLERAVLRGNEVRISDLFTADTAEISHPVVYGGRTVGEFEMTVDISWLRSAFWQRLLIASAFAAAAVAAGFAIGQRLVARATKPLRRLAGDLSGIGSEETLSYNFKRESEDEVGVLVDAFNDMMGRIDVRDRALRAYSESLEDTVQKRTSELVTARDEAERANAAKSEFLSMMSHEIRTPMNGMMVMAQMLAAAPLSPRHLRFAEIINRSGQNLLAIINDVLDISKIESGRLTLERTHFPLDQLFADVYGLFFERARERGIHLDYVIDPSVPATLIGDPTRLNQVITNLVNNALKFTETGGVVLRAAARSIPEGVEVAISVSDTGIGIAKDKLAMVFERFAQADQSITRRFGGTGLGLAISKRLVEAMDGTLSVESVEGKGSVFTAKVCVAAEDAAGAARALSGRRIVLHAANDIQRMAMTEALEAAGATVLADQADQHGVMITDQPDEVAGNGRALLIVPALELAEVSFRTRGRLEIPTPLSRGSIDALGKALAAQDLSSFRNVRRAMDQVRHHEAYRGLHALAVDDNQINREVLSEALNSMGMHVDCAANGEEALRHAAANRYDIIFMDCSMPVMDGFAATRILREREAGMDRRTPIVAITALSDNANGRDWRESGMDGWISKPFTIPSVAERIDELVLGRTAPGAQGEASADPLSAFSHVPLADEQTIQMIARLSARDSGAGAARIFNLFTANGAAALSALAASGGNAGLADNAHALKSLAQSAGAARLAAYAGHLEQQAKAGKSPSPADLQALASLWSDSERQLASRLAVSRAADQPLAG